MRARAAMKSPKINPIAMTAAEERLVRELLDGHALCEVSRRQFEVRSMRDTGRRRRKSGRLITRAFVRKLLDCGIISVQPFGGSTAYRPTVVACASLATSAQHPKGGVE